MPRPELTSVRLERGEICSRGAGWSGRGGASEGVHGGCRVAWWRGRQRCAGLPVPQSVRLGPASSVTLLPSPGSSAPPGYTWGTCCVFSGCSYGTAVAYPPRIYQMQRDLRMCKQHPLPAPAGCIWLSRFASSTHGCQPDVMETMLWRRGCLPTGEPLVCAASWPQDGAWRTESAHKAFL